MAFGLPRGGNAARSSGVDCGTLNKPGAPTTDLRTQLQSAVGNTYAIERELGGGAAPLAGTA